MSRFWDALPRLAALIACGLMLWPLVDNMVKSSARTASKLATTSFTITKSALQVDPSTTHWAIVATVQAKRQDPTPYPRMLAIVRDAEENEVFRTSIWGERDTAEPDADGLRTWSLRSVHPRTLAAERYHTLVTSLISEP